MSRARRVLVVEDDPSVLRGLVDNLRAERYDVQSAGDGEAAYRLARNSSFDVILLDVMLPGLSGFDVCGRLRKEGVATPILMLTARGEESDRVRGLDLGGDDYLTKPFSLMELLARVRALLRRACPDIALPEHARFGTVQIDFRKYEALEGQRPLKLTRKEFGALRYLIARAGEVVSRDELLQAVWDYREYPTTRTVDNHIASLRAKIEPDSTQSRHILTVHGVGYKFVW